MEDREKKKSMLEALLFLSGEPVETGELKKATGVPETDLKELLEELMSEYAERGGGVLIGKIAGGYQMVTNPDHTEWASKLKGAARKQKLSLAALETLAIIAYRQPLTKAEVEELRGVNADGVLKALLDKHLIRIVGKKEAPGKPILYGTTREFLQYFGLNDLTELPTLKDMEREDAA
jgi:segregation and condensation protein B